MADASDNSGSTTPPVTPSAAPAQPTINPQDIETGQKLLDQKREAVKLQNTINTLMDNGVDILKDTVKHVEHTNNLLDGAITSHKELNKQMDYFKTTMSDVFSGDYKKIFQDIGFAGVNSFKQIGDSASDAGDKLSKSLLSSKDVVQSAAGLIGVAASQMFKDKLYQTKIPGFNISFDSVNTALTDVQSTAEQMALGFGVDFDRAQEKANNFRSNVSESMMNVNKDQKTVISTAQMLGRSMSAEDAIKSLNGLSDAFKGTGASANVLNTALLVGSAYGEDFGAVASDIGKISLDLSEGAEKAASSMGDIASAAKNTSFSFTRAKQDILSATETLKLSGGTVQAVAPLFATFSASLRGIGKEGLTPDLLRSFTSGLAGMSTGARALIGLNMPGGQGRGALGAGLAVEEAVDSGRPEELQKVLKAMVNTVKQFGGGRIITRQEAVNGGPQAAAQFELQRKILEGQGISGAQTQARLLQIFSDVDKGKLQAGEDPAKAFKEALTAGSKVAQDGTSEVVKAQIATEAATITAGANIVDAIKGQIAGTSIQDVLKGMDQAVSEVAKKGGISMDLAKQMVTNQNSPLAQRGQTAIEKDMYDYSRLSANVGDQIREWRGFGELGSGQQNSKATNDAFLQAQNSAVQSMQNFNKLNPGKYKEGTEQYSKKLDERIKASLNDVVKTLDPNKDMEQIKEIKNFMGKDDKTRYGIEQGKMSDGMLKAIANMENKDLANKMRQQYSQGIAHLENQTNAGIKYNAFSKRERQDQQGQMQQGQTQKDKYEAELTLKIVNGNNLHIDKTSMKKLVEDTLKQRVK